MKNKKPTYMYQCVVCRKNFYTENMITKHCGKLTQWVCGIPGKGIDMESPQAKIIVKGHVLMSEENLNNLLNYGDAHQALLYALHMGYVDARNLEFITPE